MAEKTTFGQLFTNIDTKNVKEQSLSSVIEAGAYEAIIKEFFFSKGQNSDSYSFQALINIPGENKDLYVKSTNFVKKDGTPNSIGMSKLKSFLKAASDQWNEDIDFIGTAEVEETQKLTKDKKPYTVQSFASAIDKKVAVLVYKNKDGENGPVYNEVFSLAHLDDHETIEKFKEKVAETPIRVLKPKEQTSGNMQTSGDAKKASSAASKL
jgi:hypothetical protein